MSKLDSTESQDSQSTPKSPQTGKSAAASRILRAVEMSRTQQNPVAGTPPSSAPTAGKVPAADTEPAQESLRSLSAATISAGPPDAAAEATGKDDTATPRISATKAGVAAAKQAAARQTAEEPVTESPVAQAVRARAEAKSAGTKPTESKAKEEKPAAPSKAEEPAASSAPFSGVPSPTPSFWAKLPLAGKIGAIAALLLLAGGGAYYLSQSGAAKAKASLVSTPQFVLLPGAEGWNTKWAGEVGAKTGRTIQAFRSSQNLANYRIEFEGQIENKALGWVFRAQDPKNYYAYKLEVIKSGLEQVVALSRIVVINGVDAQRHYTPLKAPVRPGHTFRVRMDAKGSEFTTWIGDELVEAWQDDRLRTGAVGLLQDKDERAQVHKVQIFEMR